jgi:AcrR family transcriptional regulator
MSISDPPVRRRRSPEVARAEALSSARKLLLAGGPAAVTLKAVAADAGMGHANLLHHFGSAEGLQTALMTAMVDDLAATLNAASVELQAGRADLDDLVRITFDAFANGGAGQLSAWLSVTRQHGHLEAVGRSLAQITEGLTEPLDAIAPGRRSEVSTAILFVALLAMSDAVMGRNLKAMLGQDPDAVRRLAARLLPALLEGSGELR